MKLFPVVFFSCLCIGFSYLAYVFSGRADASYDSRQDDRAIISVVSAVKTFIRVESLGNRRAAASVIRFTRALGKNANGVMRPHPVSRKLKRNAGTDAISAAHPPVFVPIASLHAPAVRSRSLAYERIRIITPINQADVLLARSNTTRSASYLNYDVFGSSQGAYGTLAYGMRVGSGVAQITTLARAAGDQRGIMVTGLGWQRQSASGNMLMIGDAQSRQGKYEESVRFDGVQYAGQSFSYEAGWERADLGDSAMHFGRFMTEATAWKPVGRRLTAQAHLFADSSTRLLALGAIWTTPHSGQVEFGIAPASGRGLTGFFGYTFSSPRLSITLQDRTWGAHSFQVGELVPQNYRQLGANIQYSISRTTKLHLGFGNQSQGGFSVHTTSLGLVQTIEGKELHVDFSQNGSAFARSAGLVTYLSLPLGGGRSVIAQNTLAGGMAAKTVTLKQDTPSSGVGTSYAVDFGQNGTSFTDATLTSHSVGSTTQVQISRFGGPLSWSSEFSGSLVFLGGKPFAANQTIDQSSALTTLKGRSSATVMLVTMYGKLLPAGSIVRALNEDGSWRIDDDGRVALDDIAAGPQTLLVSMPSGSCVVGIVVPPSINTAYDIGKQICR